MIAAGGLVWFDYLNVIDVKTVLSPVYKLLGLNRRTQKGAEKGVMINLDSERLAVLIEGLDLRNAELDKVESSLKTQKDEIAQMAAELEDRQKNLDDRENSLNAAKSAQEAKDESVEQFASYLTNMPPDAAVRIITAMDDQEIIDLFKKVEEIAAREGTASMVSVWLMNENMPPPRAAEISRKMSGRL